MGSRGSQISKHADDQNQVLQALTLELKIPLIKIARQAELEDPASWQDIQQIAEQSLALIDGFLLSAQSEYGQVSLDLEPAVIGSVLYETSSSLHTHATKNNISFTLDDRTHEPVMTNRAALTSVLSIFSKILIGCNQTDYHRQIILRGYRTGQGRLGVGAFADVSLSQEDIDKALELKGEAHLPLARSGQDSHASLAIADVLCRAVGGRMSVKQMGGLRGLVTELPRSEQLSLV